MALDLQANPEKLCPVCGQPFAKFSEEDPHANEIPFVCQRCQTLYHQDCWEKVECCCVRGCISSKTEAISLSLKQASKKTCPQCQAENPRAAARCLACDTAFVSLPETPMFTSADGWRAHTPEELLAQLDTHWDSAVRHLYLGDIEQWLAEKGRKDWAEAAKKARVDNRQRSVGLEAFLEATGTVEKPVAELSAKNLVVEGPGPFMETFIDISNSGRGYLSGRISSEEVWLNSELFEFAGNKQRIPISIDFTQFTGDEQTGVLEFDTVGGKVSTTVKVTRIGIAGALSFYEKGDYARARILCHRLTDAQLSMGDATMLNVACCIKEDNDVAAVAALRRLTGVPKQLPSHVCETIYEWLKSHEDEASRLDKLPIYEALMPGLKAEEAEAIKRELAGLLLNKAEASVASGSGSASLWQDSQSSTQDIKDLLGQAAELDPQLSSQVSRVKHSLSMANAKAKVGNSTWLLAIVLLIVGAGAAFYYASQYSLQETEKNLTQALAKNDYALALSEVRILYQNEPQNPRYQQQFAKILTACAKQSYKVYDLAATESFRSQALSFALDNPPAASVVCDDLMEWAKEEVKAGRSGEARIIMEGAHALKSDDPLIAGELAAIQPKTETFWNLYQISKGTLGNKPFTGYAALEENRKALQELRKMGVKVYSERMSLAFQDVTGDGLRELITAGTDKAPNNLEIGRFTIYGPSEGPKLQELYSGESRDFSTLSELDCADLSGQNRADLVLTWWNAKNHGESLTQLVAVKDGKLVSQKHDCKMLLQIKDRSRDGRAEIWVPEVVAKSTGEYERVIIYTPCVWNEPGFSKAVGNFSVFYQDSIDSLQEQINQNPYPDSDPKQKQYNADRQKAIALLRSRMGK